MPTNRPFFANFLAAFRAHTALTKASTTTSVSASTAVVSASQFGSLATNSTNTTPSGAAARAIAAKSSNSGGNSGANASPTGSGTGTATAGSTAAVVMQAASQLAHSKHTVSSTSPSSRSPPSMSTAAAGATSGFPRRRGSDTSSEGGFRDPFGGEKWYIGGRTAGGEERFYGLAMARRERSGDRSSFDRLSL